MFKKFLLTAGAGVILLAMIGCTVTGPAANSPLVGTWNLTKQINSYSTGSKDTTEASALFSNKYVFKDDYSLSGTTVLLGITINFTGTWSEKDGSVTINATIAGQSNTTTYQYSVNGNELTLTGTEVEGTVTKTTVEKYVKQ
jgi:hypothetical protein